MAQRQAEAHEDQQHEQFGGGKEGLTAPLRRTPRMFNPERSSTRSAAPTCRPVNRSGKEWPAIATGLPKRFFQAREKVGEVDDEAGGDGGNRPALGHHKLRPAVEESRHRSISPVHVNVFAARLRQRRTQFRVTQRSEQAEDAGGNPDHQHQRGRAQLRAA